MKLWVMFRRYEIPVCVVKPNSPWFSLKISSHHKVYGKTFIVIYGKTWKRRAYKFGKRDQVLFELWGGN